MKISILPIAKLAFIDKILDEYKNDMGDLPDLIKGKEAEIHNAKVKIMDTETILNDIRAFVSTAKLTLVTLKDKEDKLIQQQFLVRNNKEFDALSAEISTLKSEHEKLSVAMRSEGVKEENLLKLLEEQNSTLAVLQQDLSELHTQYDVVAATQNEEVAKYSRIRKIIKDDMDEELYGRYARIRNRLEDAAVYVHRDSCMGCYRAIPKQIIVEMRNQPERIFWCEHCGRLLIPDWVEVDEDDLESLA